MKKQPSCQFREPSSPEYGPYNGKRLHKTYLTGLENRIKPVDITSSAGGLRAWVRDSDVG
jgi:hypothetical protein